MKILAIAFLGIGFQAGAAQIHPRITAAPSRDQFTYFFSGWQEMIQTFLVQNCSEPYDNYRHGVFDPYGQASQLVSPVVECLLQTFPEHNKAESVSAVILGLLPTMLQYLGSTPVETAIISIRRPFLSLLLAAGSPSVAPMKVADFTQLINNFVKHGERRPVLAGIAWMRQHGEDAARWITLPVYLVQFIVVAGAAGNVINLVARLSYHALAVIAPEEVFLVLLWGLMCLVIHLVAVAILHLRVRVWKHEESFVSAIQQEVAGSFLKTSAFQPPLTWELRHTRSDSKGLSEAISEYMIWGLCFGTVLNLVYGTMVFSGLLFHSIQDSLFIAVRFIASSLVCRLVVRMELDGLIGTDYKDRNADIEMHRLLESNTAE